MNKNEASIVAISVVVPFRYEGFHIKNLIEHLKRQTILEPFEVLMIDNNVHESPNRQMIENAGFRYIRGPQQPDADAARNIGIKFAKGEIVAFTDCDCRPARYWLAQGLSAIRKNKNSVIAGNICFFGLKSSFDFFDSITFLDHQDAVLRRHSCYFANVFMNINLLRSFFPIPEGYYSGSDVYFFRKLYDQGISLVFSAQATVFHPTRSWKDLMQKSYRIGLSRGKSIAFPLLQTPLAKGKFLIFRKKKDQEKGFIARGLLGLWVSRTIYFGVWITMFLAAGYGCIKEILQVLNTRYCKRHLALPKSYQEFI